MTQYRQGDILLTKTTEVKGIPANTDVLREGSVTGHHHRIMNGTIYFQPIDSNGVFAYVSAKKDCELVHEEHKPIRLSIGFYEVRRQREVTGYVRD